MHKFHAIKQLRFNGDSIITLGGGQEAILATTSFSERYIKRKRSQRFTMLKDSILLFSWTDDKFRHVKVQDIKTITPLSKVLNNISPEIVIDGS